MHPFQIGAGFEMHPLTGQTPQPEAMAWWVGPPERQSPSSYVNRYAQQNI